MPKLAQILERSSGTRQVCRFFFSVQHIKRIDYFHVAVALLSSTSLFLPPFGVICDLFGTRFKTLGRRWQQEEKKVNWGFFKLHRDYSSSLYFVKCMRTLLELKSRRVRLIQELIQVWKEKENSGKFRPCLFTSCVKRKTKHFHVAVVQWRQRNVQKAWCTCKVVVLLNKPIAFFMLTLPSPSSDLKDSILVKRRTATWNLFVKYKYEIILYPNGERNNSKGT